MASTKRQAIKQATALPECTVSTEDFLTPTKQALEARSQAALAKISEDQAREQLEALGKSLREQHEADGEYIGLIRIVGPDNNQPPVRIEFKVINGGLDVSEGETLDNLFGAVRPQLFEKAQVVTEVHDPAALFAAIQAAGHDPWTILNVTVKDGMDSIVAKMNGVTAAEAYLPKKGLLARLAEYGENFSMVAKNYLKSYLLQVLKPTVVMGTKG